MNTITFSVEQALDIIVRYREFAVVDKDIADKFAGKEEYCHIVPGENNLFKLYRRKDWLQSAEHYEELHKESNEERELRELRRAAYTKLHDSINMATCGTLPISQITMITDALVKGAKVNAAGLESYGLTKEEIARLL